MSLFRKNIRKIEKILFSQNPGTLFKKNENSQGGEQVLINNNFYADKFSFGELNPDKIFYVIKRSPGAGLFSNLTFVLNHLKIAKENNYIPFVDMQEYPSIYNELSKIYNTYNSWEYFFENVSNFKLHEIYKSKNVIITKNKFNDSFSLWLDKDKSLIELLRNDIKLRKHILNTYNRIKKNYFDKKKVLGIHFRGTTYKNSAGHPLPATKKQIYNLIKKVLETEKVDYIFLSTEEKNYLNFLKKKFNDKIVYFNSSYRSDINDAFKVYPRTKHRYKLGREILIESMLLSSSDYFIFTDSNVSSFAISINLKPKQKIFKIKNGCNSLNRYICPWLWYYKSLMPNFLGGFKNNIL